MLSSTLTRTGAIPKAEYRGGRLEVGLSASETRNSDFGDWPDEASLELELAPGVPLDLDLNFGAGRAELDLTGLAVGKLVVNTGASESVIRIDEVNRERMASADFNVGAADLHVHGVGNLNAEQVTVKSGLGSVTLRLDGEWPEDGYLVVGMGLGALNLQIPRSLGVRLRRPGSLLASIETEGLERAGEGLPVGQLGDRRAQDRNRDHRRARQCGPGVDLLMATPPRPRQARRHPALGARGVYPRGARVVIISK